MPVRVTGMVSGLDTEALVSAMVSAYSVKKKKSEKNVQTLKWKQESWSGLNTKLKTLHSSLSNLRFTSAYSLKKATVSDPTKATVTAGANAVTGSQKLVVKKLAAAGYLTGAQLKKGDGKSISSSTKLSELKDGLGSGSGSISVTVGGKTSNITVDKDTTIGSFVNSLKDAGLSANFDEKNGRIFVAAQKSGTENDFSLVANNSNGFTALTSLGLNVQSDANEAMYKAYKDYGEAGNAYLGGRGIESAADVETILRGINADKASITEKKEIVAGFADEKQYAQNLKDVKEAYSKMGDAADGLKTLLGHGNFNDYAVYNETTGEYEFYSGKETVNGVTTYFNEDENGVRTTSRPFAEGEAEGKHGAVSEVAGELVKTAIQSKIDSLDPNSEEAKALNDEFKSEVQKVDADGKLLDANGDPLPEGADPVMEPKFDTGKISAYLSGIASRENSMATYKTENAEKAANIDSSTNLDGFMLGKQESIDMQNAAINALQDKIDANRLANVGEIPDGHDEESAAALTQLANDIWDKISYYTGKYNEVTDVDGEGNRTYSGYSEGAVRVNAEDAEIELNGAAYTNSSNNFSINGLSINVTGTTDEKGVTITTDTDSQAIYDKIKDFLKQYNEILTEMAKMYNADSAKGYEPLSEEDKDKMSDKEVEKWEQKIKDASLRKDGTLNNVMYAITSSMSQRYEINGKYYSLASFGIKTKNYFETSENDNYEYHIDGDKDDKYSSGNSDKLLAAITADPDSVVEFFKQLSAGVYDALDKKMRTTTMSSAYSVYNDKQMKTQLANYEKEVTDWEKKITDYEDYWYRKYASMESTLAKLQSQTSQLGSMMG